MQQALIGYTKADLAKEGMREYIFTYPEASDFEIEEVKDNSDKGVARGTVKRPQDTSSRKKEREDQPPTQRPRRNSFDSR